MVLASYERPAREAKALAHPTRLAALALIQGGVRSASAIWRELRHDDPSLTINHIIYHLHQLRKARVIERVRYENAVAIYALTDRGNLLLSALMS